jgi:ribose transport system substrate-binding protein
MSRRYVRPASAVVALVATTTLAVFASTALGAGAKADAGAKVRVAFFGFASANTYTEAAYRGAQAAAKKAGNVEVVYFDGQANPEKQAKDMQDALTSGNFDGWTVYQIGPAAWRMSQQAIGKGVKIVGMLVPFGPDPSKTGPQLKGQLASTYFDHAELGRDLGALTVSACKGLAKCKVEYLYGYKFIPFSPVIRSNFDKVVKAHPSIQVVSSQDGEYPPTRRTR